MARRLIIVATVLVLLVGGAFAVFALRGSDAPPPPALSRQEPTATATATATQTPATTWEVAAGEETFVGYRVREEFASIGVADAVGRTGEVTGTAEVDGDRITGAELEADMPRSSPTSRAATTRCANAGSRPPASRRRSSSSPSRSASPAATRRCAAS